MRTVFIILYLPASVNPYFGKLTEIHLYRLHPINRRKKSSKPACLLDFWRRVRDSNPRSLSGHSISSAAPSTTRTTLHFCPLCPQIFHLEQVKGIFRSTTLCAKYIYYNRLYIILQPPASANQGNQFLQWRERD